MTINAGDLLRALGGGVLPQASTAATKPGGVSQTLDFAALLGRAQGGELQSGRPLHIDNAVQAEFSPSQLARLGDVADAADAAGAKKLFAILDGQGVVIDIASRTIERVVSLDGENAGTAKPGDVLVGVDSTVVVPKAGEEFSAAAATLSTSRHVSGGDVVGGILARIENGSLLEHLAETPDVRNVFDLK